MANTLGKRLTALEHARPIAPAWTIFVVAARKQPHELHAVRTQDGAHTWQRCADESEEAFRARAEREAPRNAMGVTLLVEVVTQEVER